MSSSERDEFARFVARMAVAQICNTTGFHSAQTSAVEALADIAIRYLRDLCKAAHLYSNLACRVESNVFDVILALEDIGPNGAAADPNRPISRSPALREVMRFVEYGKEVPFAQPLPRFPIPKKRYANPSFAQLREAPTGSHIPSWLPALPDPHTYRNTPVLPDRKRDPAANRLEQARQRRKGENTYVALHQKLLGYKEGTRKTEQNLFGALEEDVKLDNANPFLMPALEGKEVSPVMLGGVKDSILDAFASVVENEDMIGLEVQEGGINANEDGLMDVNNRDDVELKDRDRVVLTFDFGGKMGDKGKSVNKILGVERQVKKMRVVKEEEKDERKRRAEQILAQAMDNVAA